MSDAIATIEGLLAEAEQLADPHARALTQQLAGALIDLAGAGVTRACELGGAELTRRLADDELVGNLMVLCDRHPDPPHVRAHAALASRRGELASIGVVLDGVDEGVRVRLHSERGESPDGARVRALVEAIVTSRAPDVDTLVIEVGGKPIVPPGFVTIDRLRAST